MDATRPIRKVVWAGAIGTLIEYYDYTAYAFLATTLATLFFPANEPLALLYPFAVFGVAFVVRPIGGILLGALADKVVRKPALLVSVVGMVSATACIGLVPTYATAGIAAPVLLCLLRCIQGMAAGGEMGGAVTYVAEVAPDAKRAALTSTTQIGCLVGTLGGAIAVALLNMLMTQEHLLDWGWRLPFLISAPMGIIALMIRHKMEETPDFVQLERQNKVKKAPTLILLRRHPGALFAIACIGSCAMAGYYLPFTYLVTYFQKQGIMTAQTAGWSASLSMMVAALAIYPFGLLSDKIGRRPTLIGVTLCFKERAPTVLCPYQDCTSKGVINQTMPVFALYPREPVSFLARCRLLNELILRKCDRPSIRGIPVTRFLSRESTIDC